MHFVYIRNLTDSILAAIFLFGLIISGNISASHHIDCTDPLNANNSECAGFIDCNDPINLIYPQCQGGTTVEPVAPTALFNLTPSSGEAPLTVTVNATASSDSDGQINSYSWSASDGQTASGQIANMTFSSAGKVTITLTIEDNQGLSASASKELTITAAVAAATDCMSVFNAIDSQLTLYWVNLMSGENIASTYSDVVMQLLAGTNNGLQFQVTTAQPSEMAQIPSENDCISSYDPGNGILMIPAVKSGADASTATYKNIRMNLMVPADLIFKLESVENVR